MKTMRLKLKSKAKYQGQESDLYTCYENGHFLVASSDPDLIGWECEVEKFLLWDTVQKWGKFENVAEIQAELRERFKK